MNLTNPQIDELADELDQHSDDGRLQLMATDLGVNWANLTNGITPFRERAATLIRYLNGQLPPRDAELLEMVRTRGNARLQAVAARLMAPTYYSPTGDAHDATVLGRTAFIARPDLRARIHEFTTGANNYTTRMLVVRGGTPGGKSYTWEYLKHLAFATVGAQPFRHRLKGKGEAYLPRHLFEDVFRLLDLDASALPPLTDDPQLARLDALLATFKGKIVGLGRRSWLVIDDLNEPTVTPAVREAAFAMAQAAEELKPQRLWIALLGYNDLIADPDLRHILQDDAEYPTAWFVAQHLQALSSAGPNPLAGNRATEIADLLFQKYQTLDKAAMIELTARVEQMGEKLRNGQQP
ncbi:MAG: hypothetical protein JZU52_19505 [Lamprocystis purpurea]|jgi:hypothetical protein|uniref:hypothetical protein n=1 Tax=Lamprocystis purpurea TaxID=61598 RepID=UPI00036EC836|nr:hypothetical protein [Lamprocystis purpurea]MBV5275725.1 hypothetical protein [Lamprocystis purpurea]